MNEIFDSAVRSSGDLAGVVEFDGEVGYFYLYNTTAAKDHKVVAAIRVLVGSPDFDESDISVHWDSEEKMVGLFIRSELWAAFDSQTGAGYGGDYSPDRRAAIPTSVIVKFASD